MKGQPIAIALGFVCVFSLGIVAGAILWPRFQTSPASDDGMARMVVNGNTVEYPAGSAVEYEDFGNTLHDGGTHSIARDTTATSGGLSTNSERLAAAYQQTAPTDGLGASGGGIVASIEAVGGKPLNALYVIAALAIIGGGVAAFGFKQFGLGLGLALGGLGVAAIAYFATEQPWVFWLLIPLAGSALGWWLYSSGVLKATKAVAVPITKGLASLKATNPAAFEAATSAIGEVSGTVKGTPQREKMDRTIRKLKASA